MYGKPCKRDWVAKVVYLIQMLPTLGGCCNRYFWDIRLKILRLPNFNMPFQLVLTKFFKSELFSCLQKVGHVIKSFKEAYSITSNRISCRLEFETLVFSIRWGYRANHVSKLPQTNKFLYLILKSWQFWRCTSWSFWRVWNIA